MSKHINKPIKIIYIAHNSLYDYDNNEITIIMFIVTFRLFASRHKMTQQNYVSYYLINFIYVYFN